MKEKFVFKQRRHFWLVLIVILCTIVLELLGLLRFNHNLHKVAVDYSIQQSEELSEYVKFNIQVSIRHYVRIFEVMNTQLVPTEPILSDQTAKQLNQLLTYSNFNMLAISDSNGNAIDRNGNRYSFNQDEFPYEAIHKAIENNEVYISNAQIKEQEPVVFLGLPLGGDADGQNILWGMLSLDVLASHIEFSDDSYTYFQVVDNKGDYLLSSNNQYAIRKNHPAGTANIWDELEHYQYGDDISAETLYILMQEGTCGHFSVEGNGQGRYANFRPLGINNWYLFSVQIDDELNSFIHQSRQITGQFFIIFAIGTFTVFGTIFLLVYSMYKKIATQNREIQNVVAMFQAILHQTKNTPFIIDHNVKQFVFYAFRSSDVTQILSFDRMLPETLLKEGILEADSFATYQALYEHLVIEKTICAPVILRLNQMWLRISVISDALSSKGQIIGVIEDYDELKEKDLQIESHLVDIKKIKQQSRLDFLTRIYNREAFLEQFQFAFAQSRQAKHTGALLSLDLDHFKDINDHMGHATGDIVLQEIAHILLDFFHGGEIVGRFGGDEFMIFVPDILNRSAFDLRMQDLNRLLRRIYQKDGQSVSVSASIGIAITDNDNATFQTLYDKADLALYHVKNSTRNGYNIYSEPELV